MEQPSVIIIGGGLAGLSAACYAQASGFRTTIVEHNIALGGVCTAWTREPYTIDGCIHWLTGGPFERLYRELGILPGVELRILREFATYRDAKDGRSLSLCRDPEALARALCELAPEDREEVGRIMEGASHAGTLDPGLDKAQELLTLRERLHALWEMRHDLPTLVRFRKPLTQYADEHLRSYRLRQLVCTVFPKDAPALLMLFVLGFLQRGYLSRPVGGTARFRDVLVNRFHATGGTAHLNCTVDEVLIDAGAARGVRLSDGAALEAEHVICTSSMPETVLRLLTGRYEREVVQRRLERWKMIDPVVLASFGVALPLRDVPPMLLIDGIAPLDTGGRNVEQLYLRVYNEEDAFAPKGHTVVQAMLPSSYKYWATRNTHYQSAKQNVLESILNSVDEQLPGVKSAVRMTDLATPLTYWRATRSWHGAYEGWMPSTETLFGHIDKRVPGLSRFHMAGQWVEPGGGVPAALMSGRQAVQLMCAEHGRRFSVPSA